MRSLLGLIAVLAAAVPARAAVQAPPPLDAIVDSLQPYVEGATRLRFKERPRYGWRTEAQIRQYIDRSVAERMGVLGATVTGVRRTADADVPEGVTSVVPAKQLHDVLPDADVVVVCAPHTRDTRGLIGDRELRLLPPHAVLINVSRGQLIDEAALVAALRERRIEGAALDVFDQEPLPPDHPLWTLPNVLITPHTAAFAGEYWPPVVDQFLENMRRYKEGKPLLNVVDKEAGY